MARLTLCFLGPLEAKLDGEPVAGLATNKVRALLAYLAVESERPHRREVLAGLLWPDWPQRSARTNLRNALSTLRSAIGDRDADPPYLLVTRETLQFNRQSDHWLDVAAFDELAESGAADRLEEGIALYRGLFLEGFSVRDSPTFEDWAQVVRERLARQALEALQELAERYAQQGNYARACAAVRRQLEMDPGQEQAHRALMRLLALSGQRSAALAQYEACRRALREELDVEPGEETIALYRQIRDGQIGPPRQDARGTRQSPLSAPEGSRPHAMSPQPIAPGSHDLPPSPREPPPSAPKAPSLAHQFPPSPAPSAGPTPLQGERRLATIILADVQGSTGLFERIDTEAWVEIMNQVFQILGTEIYRYGGEIDQYRGDGLVAFFGVSSVHEDDPERAVLAALAMQKAIGRYATGLAEREGIELRLRIGINTGQVIAGGIGSRRQHWEQTAMGEAVALAARMETAAQPGTVLVTESTYRLVQPLFEWEPLGKITVKGVHRPVAVYRPLAHRGISGKGRGIAGLSSPMVGRQVELQALQEAVARLQDGIGGIVTLVGEAGLGKSRLVTESQRWASAELADLVWVEGRCLSYAANVAYQVWLDMLRGLPGVAPDAPPLAVRDSLQEWVQDLCPDRFDEVYPFLARMMSLPLGNELEARLRGLGAEGLRAGTFRAVETVVWSAAQHRPLVLVCEDLHWADPTSLALLQQVLALTDRVPLLLICVLRPETEHGCWQIKEVAARLYRHRHTDLWLDPLTTDESAALVSNLLTQDIEDLPEHLRTRIFGHAEGNPFFVEEILRALIDGQTIVRDGATGRWRTKRNITDFSIPDAVHGVLMARIDHLPEVTRRVLQMASVIGRVFSYRILAAIQGGIDLDAHLLTLQRAGLIRERAGIPETAYIFKHVLTQEAAYSGLLKRERRADHRRVAEALEQLYPERLDEHVALLAYHWEEAEEPAKAIPYLLRAGDQARTAYANKEAIAHYWRALARFDEAKTVCPRDWELEALKGLGEVYFGIGRVEEAEECFEQAIAIGHELGLPPGELVELYFWLGEVYYWQFRPDDMIRVGEKGLALLGDDRESVQGARMNQVIAVGLANKGENGREYTLQTTGFLQSLPYTQELRPAYEHVIEMHLYADANADQAAQWLEEFERRASLCHDLRALGTVCRLKGEILELTGNLRGAATRYEQALELYTLIGDTKHASDCLVFISRNQLNQGDLKRAAESARECVETKTATEHSFVAASAQVLRGTAALCQGRPKEALDAFCQNRAFWSELGSRGRAAYAACSVARVHLCQGNRQEALRQLEEALSMMPSAWLAGALFILLSGFEAAYDDPKAFRAFCHRLWQKYPELQETPLVQWYLEPAERHVLPALTCEGFSSLLAEWIWHDKFGDCSYEVQDGLVIWAANGRGLSPTDQSAPRLVRQVSGDLSIQTTSVPLADASCPEQVPAIGGLLLRQDERNWLAVLRGSMGERDVTLGGLVDGQGRVVGRGRVPSTPSQRIHLCLERTGERVSALCSTNGRDWFTVGHTAFPIHDPLQVGFVAVGAFQRLYYPGAYPDGTAIRFESLNLWQQSG